jgi:hypothetical protein
MTVSTARSRQSWTLFFPSLCGTTSNKIAAGLAQAGEDLVSAHGTRKSEVSLPLSCSVCVLKDYMVPINAGKGHQLYSVYTFKC